MVGCRYASELDSGLTFDGVAYLVELRDSDQRSRPLGSIEEAMAWLDAAILETMPRSRYVTGKRAAGR